MWADFETSSSALIMIASIDTRSHGFSPIGRPSLVDHRSLPTDEGCNYTPTSANCSPIAKRNDPVETRLLLAPTTLDPTPYLRDVCYSGFQIRATGVDLSGVLIVLPRASSIRNLVLHVRVVQRTSRTIAAQVPAEFAGISVSIVSAARHRWLRRGDSNEVYYLERRWRPEIDCPECTWASPAPETEVLSLLDNVRYCVARLLMVSFYHCWLIDRDYNFITCLSLR